MREKELCVIIIYMKFEAICTIKNVLYGFKSTDPSLTEDKIKSIIAVCENDKINDKQFDFAIGREEAAFILNKDVRTIDYHCRKGDFQRLKIGKANRSSGISALSIANAVGMGISDIWETHIRYTKSIKNAA